jgi:hypothetical protein
MSRTTNKVTPGSKFEFTLPQPDILDPNPAVSGPSVLIEVRRVSSASGSRPESWQGG